MMKTKHMKKTNDNAMAIGAIVFGVFCLFAIVAWIIYVMAINNQQTTYTDTFGNTASPVTNTSQSVIDSTSSIGSSTMIPLVLIGGVVAILATVFLIWVASKAWGGR